MTSFAPSPTDATITPWSLLFPASFTNVNDITTGIVTTQFPIHGGRANESRMTVDGLNIGNPPGGGQPPTYVADVGNAQEISFTTMTNNHENTKAFSCCFVVS